MNICQCGCGEEIPLKPYHAWRPPKYLPQHFQKLGLARKGKFQSNARLETETPCACGCGGLVSPRKSNGQPRYIRSTGGKAYLHGHGTRGKQGAEIARFRGEPYLVHGYRMVYVPEHPQADKRGYVLEHRHVWEQANGRLLSRKETIHHINHDRSDNRLENLQLVTRSEHALAHRWWEENPIDPARYAEWGRKGAASRWGKKSVEDG